MNPARATSIVCLLLCGLVSGCTIVKVTPNVKYDAAPQVGSGYVAARVSGVKNTYLAFVVHNLGTGSDYDLSLGGGVVYRPISDQISTIAVPPGRYVVTSWVTFATMTKAVLKKEAVDNPILGMPFEVKPGAVTFLGDFDVSYDNDVTMHSVTMSWRLQPLRIRSEAARSAFVTAYPAFGASRFACILCSDTAAALLRSLHAQN